MKNLLIMAAAISAGVSTLHGGVVAQWMFDEQIGLYPSCVLEDTGPNDYPVVIGPGGEMAPGKFGNALAPIERPPVQYPMGSILFGLLAAPVPEGRTAPPMSWHNAKFAALMTLGEKHLRNEVGFANATETKLNLGAFDWTVEFWYRPMGEIANEGEGVVLEVGEGPRGENEHVTRLSLNAARNGFTLFNYPTGTKVEIPSAELGDSAGGWRHLAFVHDAGKKRLTHFVDGRQQSQLRKVKIEALPVGDEAYLSIGRDGVWGRPLPGAIDELRISDEAVYARAFSPPGSYSEYYSSAREPYELKAGPAPLFEGDPGEPLPLGSRKHVFIDDALAEEMENIAFNVNPPRLAEQIVSDVKGGFRKHLSVAEDEDGVIRIYNGVSHDFLGVRISRDGVNFEVPDLGTTEKWGQPNIVIPESTAVGAILVDPNGPPEERWKYISGYNDRALYVYTSPDGWFFKRQSPAAVPFKSGSQTIVFYDDQRQSYVGFHRTDYPATPAGKTQREFVRTEVKDLFGPWLFDPLTREDTLEIAKSRRLKPAHPWYTDNGPLTPPGFGIEFPRGFAPKDGFDPVGTDVYVPKTHKYAWASDTYVAFPNMYFHYEGDGPETRHVLGLEERGRGSGPIETQLAVSRDGVHWKRYPRPTYVGIGRHGGIDVHQSYMGHGMVRRGDEIWQYYYGTVDYHSPWKSGGAGGYEPAVFRVVQRLDGFVSADAPYDRYGYIKTKPLKFKGNRLALNIDTDAAGYAQVGLLDGNGKPIEGYTLDDCIYINGDFVETAVEWLDKGTDVSPLSGKTVQVVFRMRGTKLYAMQFKGE